MICIGKKGDQVQLISKNYIQEEFDHDWIKLISKTTIKNPANINKQRTTNEQLWLQFLGQSDSDFPLIPYQESVLISNNTLYRYKPSTIIGIETIDISADPYSTDPFEDSSLHSTYTFDNTLNDLLGNHNLIASDDVEFKQGRIDRCLELKDSWYYPHSLDKFPSFERGFTISFFIYPIGPTHRTPQGVVQFSESLLEITSNGSPSTRQPYIWLDGDGKSLYISVSLENGTVENINTGIRLDHKKWQHVAVVIMDYAIEVYVETNFMFRRNFSSKIRNSSCYLITGTCCIYHTSNCRLDHLQIFSRPLVQEEIYYIGNLNSTIRKTLVGYNISDLQLVEPPSECHIIENKVNINDVQVSSGLNSVVFRHPFNRNQGVQYLDKLVLKSGNNFYQVSVTPDKISRSLDGEDLVISVDISSLGLSTVPVNVYVLRSQMRFGIAQPLLELGNLNNYCLYDRIFDIDSATRYKVDIPKSSLTDGMIKVLTTIDKIDLNNKLDVQIINRSEDEDYITLSFNEVPSVPNRVAIRPKNFFVPTIDNIMIDTDNTDMIEINYNSIQPSQSFREFQFVFETIPVSTLILQKIKIDLAKENV